MGVISRWKAPCNTRQVWPYDTVLAACCTDRRPTPFPRSDRFFLGGIDSLRGFCTKGAGPSGARRPVDSSLESEDGSRALSRDALGGDLLCSTSAAVMFEVRNCNSLWRAHTCV